MMRLFVAVMAALLLLYCFFYQPEINEKESRADDLKVSQMIRLDLCGGISASPFGFRGRNSGSCDESSDIKSQADDGQSAHRSKDAKSHSPLQKLTDDLIDSLSICSASVESGWRAEDECAVVSVENFNGGLSEDLLRLAHNGDVAALMLWSKIRLAHAVSSWRHAHPEAFGDFTAKGGYWVNKDYLKIQEEVIEKMLHLMPLNPTILERVGFLRNHNISDM